MTNRLRGLLFTLPTLAGLSLAAPPVPSLAAELPPTGAATLDPAKQKKIWDQEHTAFLLETYFGKKFNEALVARDKARMLSMLKPDFTGTVLDPAGGASTTATLVTQRKQRAGSVPALAVDAAGFIDHLLAAIADFERVERTAFKVLFINAPVEGEPAWSTTIRIEVGGRTKQSGPIEMQAEFEARFVFADEEELKAGGRALARATATSTVRRSSPRLLMEEVTESTGLADLPLPDNWNLPVSWVRLHRYQLAVEDFDRDGWLDFAIGSTDGRAFLLRSIEGRRFENVAEAFGVTAAAQSPQHLDVHALVGFIDYDNDGWPDLLSGNRLYHNESGKRFTDVTAGSGLSFDRVPFGIAVADYDLDGRLDLYIVYQKGFEARPAGKRPWVGDVEAGTENHLWHNEGGGKFKNVTAETRAGGGRHQNFAAATFFFDDDRYPDLYLAHDFGPNVLLRNRGDGSFEDVTLATGTGDYSTSMGVATGDLDNDGSNEIYVGNMYSKQGRRVVAHIAPEDYPPGIYDMIVGALAGNRLYRRSATGERYDELSSEMGVNAVGWAYAPSMVDLNGDGWLDLFATAGYNSMDRSKPDG